LAGGDDLAVSGIQVEPKLPGFVFRDFEFDLNEIDAAMKPFGGAA
jgi:hypothetical protein